MALSIDRAVSLVEQRSLERAYLMVLLHWLEFDVDVRRILEELQDAPFLERHSIRVEQSREMVQEQLALVEEELAGAVVLLRRAAENQQAMGQIHGKNDGPK